MSSGGAMQWHGMRVIARGANRICVHDPDLPGHCLKYELPPVPGMRRYWRRRLRHTLSQRLPGLGLNAIELAAWQRLHARLGKALEEHVAPCVGIVRTPAGAALRSRLVADARGSAVPTIAALLDDHPDPLTLQALAEALDRFQAWLLAHRIPLSDLNPGNFAVVWRGDELRLVCVDIKSTVSGRGLVPLYRWSWALMRRKILRRCARLRGRLEKVQDVPQPVSGARTAAK